MPDHSAVHSALEAQRSNHLSTALGEAVEWIATEKPYGRRSGEHKWLSRFRTPDVDVMTVHDFLITFQLVRQGWQLEGCASALNDMIAAHDFDPVVSIPALASRFQPLTKSGYVQTSAATKFAAFAKPRSPVFIWDQLATRSARLHDWEANGRSPSGALNALYVDAVGRHSYADYARACQRKLDAESVKADFQEALAELTAALDRFGGICADRSVVTPEFIRRRYLDKLMFTEGRFLQVQKAAKAA